jgi:hypothetical protein
MSDLTEFLLARIAEDEAAADDLHRDGCGASMCPACTVGPYPCDCGLSAKARRECEAKRRIVEEHEWSERWDGIYCSTCCDERCHAGYHDSAPAPCCKTLRILASVYADRPDYRPEWKH